MPYEYQARQTNSRPCYCSAFCDKDCKFMLSAPVFVITKPQYADQMRPHKIPEYNQFKKECSDYKKMVRT
jgi:hypothetical protein